MVIESSSVSVPPTGWWRRFGFRLLAVYLMLYNLAACVSLLPWCDFLEGAIYRFWRVAVPWVGRAVLRLDAPVSLQPSGSGDKLFDWVEAWCCLVLAFLAASIWVWFDRTRRRDEPVRAGVRLALRYVLGATMIGYGLAKLIPPTQFGPPGYGRLLQSYGDFSPMGVLWTFMGTSPAYMAFSAVLEIIGGLLLFFRRTTTLGALIVAAVMANVVMLNFCYDVPVKLYSSHLFFFAIWLAWPDAERLWHMLVLNRATVPVSFAQPWSRRWMRWGAIGLKIIVLVTLLKGATFDRWVAGRSRAYEGPKHEFAGLWEVKLYQSDGEPVPPSLLEKDRWRRVVFGDSGALSIYRMNDQREFANTRLAGDRLIVVRTRSGKRDETVFRIERAAADNVRLSGKWFGASELMIELQRVPEDKFLLKNRGFHWVSEVPFNR